MLTHLFKKLFGSRNQRVLNSMLKIVAKINALEPQCQALSDEALQTKTEHFRDRLADGKTTLDDLLPEAFAVVREASRRVLGMRHFDVQLLGGMVLHSGNIAEMRTGEGKTLVATLAAYLNALTGRGVHIVTVNDYLARRDAEWMRPLYNFLGMSVGVVVPNLSQEERQAAYAADITHGTNNEFGFDYLRDNMVFQLSEKVQRPLSFAIVDEVDSILIDEARTPLIISGAADDSTDLYLKINTLIPNLTQQATKESEGDYWVDEKAKQVTLSEQGHQRAEELLAQAGLLQAGESLYDSHNILLMHHLNAALRAYSIFHRDVDYIVQNGEAVIVDEHTGRTMPGRRWSDGLHQAIEAKEGVKVRQENQTLASITFQNYFRLYHKLSGMTGTADTEAYEFQQIYGLEVIVIPTNQPMIREDFQDVVYMTADEKFAAIIEDIKKTREKGQPVLVGTTSIETSEYLSDLLKKQNIPHQVLNAKFHEQEARIIAEAGRPGAVTIATNMAGRGTDIVLGGNLEADLKQADELSADELLTHKKAWQERHDQVITAGGLYVLGTERHESRRIDNQLRGRSGRQGDPGKSRFYLSLQDNLLRIFGGERMIAIMQRLHVMEPGMAIEARMLSRRIEGAQAKVEAYNFDIRKQLLEFDDVANDQRKVIYGQRDDLLNTTDISETLDAIRHQVIEQVILQYIPMHSLEEQWNVAELENALARDFNLQLPIREWLANDASLHEENLHEKIQMELKKQWDDKAALVDSETLRQFEKAVMLQTLDQLWREHLAAMDYLRQGIHLRGYAQKNPKQEYKRESFELFVELLNRVNYQVISVLSKFEVKQQAEAEQVAPPQPNYKMHFEHGSLDALHQEEPQNEEGGAVVTQLRQTRKVGRNEVCPCGSGKKYKHCHGSITE
ncbi:MAG: preprotein translocase subunit SecA [Gammaproteobacteria bacterium]|nr:preprotein translocase subunit SecA [Gammaproteobacteria bacterium]